MKSSGLSLSWMATSSRSRGSTKRATVTRRLRDGVSFFLGSTRPKETASQCPTCVQSTSRNRGESH